MRVLMVFHAAPCSPALGPARRHLHLLEEVARRHRVSVITLAGPGQRAQFEREHDGRYERAVFVSKRPWLLDLLIRLWLLATGQCEFRRLYYRSVQRALDSAIAGGSYDLVYASTVLLGCYRLPAGVRCVADTHNVEHDALARAAEVAAGRLRRTYYRISAARTRRDERAFCGRFDAVLATSDRDAGLLSQAVAPGRIHVIANGIRLAADGTAASPGELSPSEVGRAPQHGRLVMLFSGLMSYFPNIDAVEYFLDRIYPHIHRAAPDARLLIVGADPPRRLRARSGPSIHVTGRVPEMAPFYGQASVVIVPLRTGGGTRVKVLEAMGHGVPVVTTTIGCEGLKVHHGKSVLLADEPEAFARAVLRVWRDPAVARRLSTDARALVASEYDWVRIGDALEVVLASVASRRRFTIGAQPQTVLEASQ